MQWNWFFALNFSLKFKSFTRWQQWKWRIWRGHGMWWLHWLINSDWGSPAVGQLGFKGTFSTNYHVKISIKWRSLCYLQLQWKRRSERCKHCALAVARRSEKFSPRTDRLPGGAIRPKFNQLEMVTTFTYKPGMVKIDARSFELSW